MIIDTHAHLSFPELTTDLDGVLVRAQDAGVGKIVSIACDKAAYEPTLEIALKYENVFATLGMYPDGAEFVNDELFKTWSDWISTNKKIVAIGECGLDYLKVEVPHEMQKKAFELQLKFAQENDLSVVIHNREADEDTFEILTKYKVRAVFHCYASNLEFAKKLWDAGYMTSFTGIITYPKAEELREIVKMCPNDKFMVETDSPFLAPQVWRGQRNEPSFVVEVVRKIAEIKGIDVEEAAKISSENAESFFGI